VCGVAAHLHKEGLNEIQIGYPDCIHCSARHDRAAGSANRPARSIQTYRSKLALDGIIGRQYASAGNWREDFEVFRPFFQPTKKPTKLVPSGDLQ
jgi:hypothetical protein